MKSGIKGTFSTSEMRIKNHKVDLLWVTILPFALVFLVHSAILPKVTPFFVPAAHLPVASQDFIPRKADPLVMQFELYLGNSQVKLRSSDHSIFAWPLRTTSSSDLKVVSGYLDDLLSQRLLFMSQTLEFAKNAFLIEFLVDASVRYVHFKPLLQLLSEKGISRYRLSYQTEHESNRLRKL